MIKALKLLPGAKLLDVACGTGRHSIGLARQGYQVTGLDYSSSYIEEARKNSRRSGVSPRFVRGDMRAIPYYGEFDAAVNLWTSFGYFPSLSDDRRALRSICRALKPGGKFLIELVDGGWFKKNKLSERHWHHSSTFWVLEDTRLRGGKDPALISDRIYIGPKGDIRRGRSFVRLYSPERMSRELEVSGFLVSRVGWGLIPQRAGKGRPGRFYILAKRPGPRS